MVTLLKKCLAGSFQSLDSVADRLFHNARLSGSVHNGIGDEYLIAYSYDRYGILAGMPNLMI